MVLTAPQQQGDTIKDMSIAPFSTQAAAALATAAHAGQMDKIGQAYIYHPARVAERLAAIYGPSHPIVAVGWLHDVLEDTDVTAADLRAAGATAAQVVAVEALTHVAHEPQGDYLARVLTSAMATAVKFVDIGDNTSAARMRQLDGDTRTRLQQKYQRAQQILLAEVGDPPAGRRDSVLGLMVAWDLPAAAMLRILGEPAGVAVNGALDALGTLTFLVTHTRGHEQVAAVVRTVDPALGGHSLLDLVQAHGPAAARLAYRRAYLAPGIQLAS